MHHFVFIEGVTMLHVFIFMLFDTRHTHFVPIMYSWEMEEEQLKA
jgi:hypothetical protein